MACAGADRRADRVARDPLDVVAVKQRRVVGRHPLALELRGELAEEHRRQPRPVLPGRPAGVGDDQPLPRRLAREREDQRLLAAARRRGARAAPARAREIFSRSSSSRIGSWRTGGGNDRSVAPRIHTRANSIPTSELTATMFTPAGGERAGAAVDHVLGAQRPDRPLDDVEEPVEVDLGLERREPLQAAQRHDDLVGARRRSGPAAPADSRDAPPTSPAPADRAAGGRARR